MYKHITKLLIYLLYCIAGFLGSILIPSWLVYSFGFLIALFAEWCWHGLLKDVFRTAQETDKTISSFENLKTELKGWKTKKSVKLKDKPHS